MALGNALLDSNDESLCLKDLLARAYGRPLTAEEVGKLCRRCHLLSGSAAW